MAGVQTRPPSAFIPESAVGHAGIDVTEIGNEQDYATT
jgi:hypothetical protein